MDEYATICLFILLLIDVYCFQIWVTVSKADMNIFVLVIL